jgi:hypothetical protein
LLGGRSIRHQSGCTLIVVHHIHATHQIRIAMPIDRCFRLFTPRGESLWIDDWAPRYVEPADGRTTRGMVFTTGDGDDHTVWMLVDFDPARHYSRYARVTPASRAGCVEIACTALAPAETAVDVGYTLTALTDRGRHDLEQFAPATFAHMIEGWKMLIDARLAALSTATID